MDEDKLSFLNRDEHGRFAPKETPEPPAATPEQPEPARAETPAPAAPPVTPAEPTPAHVPPPVQAPPAVPPGYVPLAAQLDEREKRQAIQRELEDYKRRYEEATKKPVELDPVTDPDAFRQHFEQEIARARFDTLANFSKTLAAKEHSAEAIKAAEEWLAEEVKTNPALWQQVQSNPHPYDFVVRQHKRSQVFTQMGDDPDAWVKKRAAELGLLTPTPEQPAPAGSPTPQPVTPLPRPSLASAPAAGGSTPKAPTGPGIAFDGVFAN